MQEQLDEYFSDLLSQYQFGLRKGYGTQNYHLAMIEKHRFSTKMYSLDICSLKMITTSKFIGRIFAKLRNMRGNRPFLTL